MDIKYTLHELDNLATILLEKYGPIPVWAFHAPMGAGKTTLIGRICKQLGITNAVTSPTFAIMNEYEGNGKIIYHMDWYRLESEAEARQAGVEAAFDFADLTLVEWPEKAPGLLPANTQHFEIEILDPEHRRIFIPS